MARILGIGIATLDIINLVERYPREDDEVRAIAQERRRGGNATNTLVVLSQLGHACSWGGVLVDEPDSLPIRAELQHYRIDCSPCRSMFRGKVPTSYIALSRDNGSRTIVHYRDLPEFGFEDFARIDLTGFDWLHFEGRAVEHTERMLAHARAACPATPRSVEIEKPRPQIERLFDGADVLLFSRVYARARGFADAAAFLAQMRREAPHAELVCTWGAQGAHALDRDGATAHSPAFAPPRVVDTIGAGDTFNAGYIDARLRGLPTAAALQAACRLAGAKCGISGFAGLGDRSDGPLA